MHFSGSGAVLRSYLGFLILVRLRQIPTIWEAGETRLRSSHTGRSLPGLLWGKSPCHWAESASRIREPDKRGKQEQDKTNNYFDSMVAHVFLILARICPEIEYEHIS